MRSGLGRLSDARAFDQRLALTLYAVVKAEVAAPGVITAIAAEVEVVDIVAELVLVKVDVSVGYL